MWRGAEVGSAPAAKDCGRNRLLARVKEEEEEAIVGAGGASGASEGGERSSERLVGCCLEE